jgi:hypothetical protein
MTSVVAVFVLLSLASTCVAHDAIRGKREQTANKETVAIYEPIRTTFGTGCIELSLFESIRISES